MPHAVETQHAASRLLYLAVGHCCAGRLVHRLQDMLLEGPRVSANLATTYKNAVGLKGLSSCCWAWQLPDSVPWARYDCKGQPQLVQLLGCKHCWLSGLVQSRTGLPGGIAQFSCLLPAQSATRPQRQAYSIKHYPRTRHRTAPGCGRTFGDNLVSCHLAAAATAADAPCARPCPAVATIELWIKCLFRVDPSLCRMCCGRA